MDVVRNEGYSDIVRAHALWGVRRIDGPRSVDILRKVLRSSTTRLQCEAASALGDLRSERAVGDLRAAKQAFSPFVAAAAQEALLRIRGRDQAGGAGTKP